MSPLNEGRQMTEERFLSPNDVAALTSLHRASIYRKVGAGEFPAPVRISERRVAFKESEVRAWMEAREKVA
jgi:prophage regulatory protein